MGRMARAVLFACIFHFSSLHATEIAITFDDAPMPGNEFCGLKERVQVFIDKLASKEVTAAFFCVGDHMQNEDALECAASLSRSGHQLANHSFHHKHLSNLSVEEFAKEVAETEMILKNYPTMRRWYRYPFLDYGNREDIGGSDEKRFKAFKKLKKMGYRDGFVTINTFDWYVNSKLLKAYREGQSIDYEKLKKVYLTLMNEWIDAFDVLWRDHVDPQKLKHVLLLHQNDINALYIEEIVDLIRQKNWTIINPDIAFKNITLPLGDLHYKKYRKTLETPKCLSCAYIEQVFEEHQLFVDEED